MMMRRKQLYIITSVITSILFLAATIVFLVVKNSATYYSVPYQAYNNVKQLQSFKDQVEEELKIDFDQLFLYFCSEICTDNNGNITYLNIESYIMKDNDCYGIQIQYNEKSSYTIIQEKIKDIQEERISLKMALGAIAVWKFETDEQEIKFIFDRELVNGVKKSTVVKQYLFSKNSIVSLQSDLEGLFGRITAIKEICYEEYYFQVK